MAVLTRSARLFEERVGLRPTYRGPLAMLDFSAHRVHSIPLVPPLPLPDVLAPTQGDPPPDRGPTEEWPWSAAT
jgi:hypothetical protein